MPIHPTALISSDAQIDPSAEIGAYVVIEGAVRIGAGCKILPHAQVLGDTVIGVLRQLRAGFPERPGDFPWSVILCGMRDVRDSALVVFLHRQCDAI